MKKLLLLIIVIALGSNSNAQTFLNVGPYNTPVATNVGEMDFLVTDGGVPYVFYLNTTTNKGSVKKWDGFSWVVLGSADFTDADPFNLRIQVYNETDVYVSYYYLSGALNQIGVKGNTTGSWSDMSNFAGGTTIGTNHAKPYDLHVSNNGDILLSFYDELGISDMQVADWNGTQFSSGTYNSSFPITVNNTISTAVDDFGDTWVVASNNSNTFLYKWNAGSWVSQGPIYSNSSRSLDSKLVAYPDVTGIYSEMSIGSAKDNGQSEMFYSQFVNSGSPNFSTFNVLLASNSPVPTQFDMVADVDNVFYFYTQATGPVLTKYDHSGTVISSTASFGTPGSKTNLRNGLFNGKSVVAYLEGTDLWVREEWSKIEFLLTSVPESCSGISGYFPGIVTVSSNNIDKQNFTVVVTPQTPSVITNADVSGFYPNYDLNIASTFQSTSINSAIEIAFFDEEGNLDTSKIFTTPLIKANDSIVSNLPFSDLCVNGGIENLANYIVPTGGQFSGTDVPADGMFDPSVFIGGGITLVTYEAYNNSGCTSSLSFLIRTYDVPIVTVNSTNAGCNDSTGTASVMISSVGQPHSLLWNNGADSSILADLPAGNYFVTVSDNNGCITSGSANVGNTSVNLVGNVGSLNCSGDNNGSIDLTIAGTSPFDIIWSNGYSTEDITGLTAGPYDVTVTDANGCVGTESFVVTEPSPISISESSNNSNCGASSGSISLFVFGGTSSYDYQWYDEFDNAIGTNSNTVTSLAGGYYYCNITDANGCTAFYSTTLNDNGAPVVTINQVTNASCANDGAIDMSYTSAVALDYIAWSTGASTEDISSIVPGVYEVWVVDVNGCTGMGQTEVFAALPATPDICVVTVDSATTKNLIVWEKPVTTSISHFNIYREGSQAGLYQIVDSVLYADESSFVDQVASPMVRSWRYKISTVDMCGNESSLSDYHKTIHATINVGLGGNYNILWDAYEGVTYTQVACWRYTNAGGFVLAWTGSSNTFSYTDTPPTTAGLDYVVGFNNINCTSTKATSYNGTRSNRSAGVFDPSGLSIDENLNSDFDVMLFPNPNDGKFSVHITGVFLGNFDFQITDVRGKIVLEGTQYLRKFDLNLSNLEAGIYYLNILNNGVMKIKKVIIK